MNKKEAISYLQTKLYGSPEAIKYIIFEAVHKIETGLDVQKVLDWFNDLEKLYNKDI